MVSFNPKPNGLGAVAAPNAQIPMNRYYLLPCACGKKIEVEGSQAGLSVRCSCGAELSVPTMRGLASLERTEPRALPSERPSAPWGPRQGLIFLGLLIVLGASLGGLYIWWFQIPRLPTINDAWLANDRTEIENMTLEELWEQWQQFQIDLEDRGEMPEMYRFLQIETEGWRRLKVCGGVLVFGLVVTALGLCIRAPGRRGRGEDGQGGGRPDAETSG